MRYNTIMLKRSKIIGIVTVLIVLSLASFLYFSQKKPQLDLASNSTQTTSSPSPTDPKAICHDCNVLLIIADTLRADYLSSYGYPQQTSPQLDQLAKEGYVFKNNYSNIPFTPPSHWSIMTGWYPDHHQLLMPSADPKAPAIEIPIDMPLLPLMMKDYGYTTSGFVSSPSVGFLADYFDNFIEYDEQSDPSRTTGFRKTTDSTLDWLRKNKENKFFLFIHYWDVHTPYEPIAAYDTFQPTGSKKLDLAAAKYAGELKYMDNKIGEIINEITALGLEKNTLIVFTSDHGENFGEYQCDDFTWDKGPCEDHSVSVLEPEIHTPLIIKIPGRNEAQTIESITQSVDLLPTILELTGIPLTESVDGSSLLELIEGKTDDSKFAYSVMPKNSVESDIYTTGLRWDKWKLIRISWKGNQSNRDKLIMRLHDTNQKENINLFSQESELTKDLLQQIEILEPTNPLEGLSEENLDEETIKLLKSLGYL